MKVLFIDTVHPVLKERLEEAGFHCTEAYESSREEILDRISDFQGVVIRSKFTIDKNFLDSAHSLKFIARSGSGLENIDLRETARRGIAVFNSPEGNRDAVAEHAMGMLLMLFNKLKKGDAEVRKGIWLREENRGIELGGKTVGIIGYGNTGRAFAKRLAGFECKVLAYDKYKPEFDTSFATPATPEDIFEMADIVSFHVPLTDETTYLFDKQFIDKMSQPFYLINTSRGKVVNTEALVKGLKSGKVKGACLDVLEYESKAFDLKTGTSPEPIQYLINADNVILSPHVAGWTVESYYKLSAVLAEKILARFGRKGES